MNHKHTTISPEAADLIEQYYRTYTKLWLKPIENDPTQNEYNRRTAMGIKIMRDLLLNHVEKEPINAE